MNPSLPLTSRHLLTTRSTARNEKLLAASMLSTDSSSVHTDILRRRFLTLPDVSPLLLNHVGPEFGFCVPYASRFRHPYGTAAPVRLFRNITEGSFRPGEFLKIRFMRSLQYFGADFCALRDVLGFSATAKQSLEDAVEARNTRAVAFLVYFVENLAIGALFQKELEEYDCENVEIVHLLLHTYSTAQDHLPSQQEE
ncbi:MAG: hypothetical protein M1829_006355 [Trizodia sp. TS-e1964]|nr:MAG: hypothetical protein M1829_006355 [Trizodia sp. TS-e1964]